MSFEKQNIKARIDENANPKTQGALTLHIYFPKLLPDSYHYINSQGTLIVRYYFYHGTLWLLRQGQVLRRMGLLEARKVPDKRGLKISISLSYSLFIEWKRNYTYIQIALIIIANPFIFFEEEAGRYMTTRLAHWVERGLTRKGRRFVSHTNTNVLREGWYAYTMMI